MSADTSKNPEPVRKPYAKPALMNYGDIKEMTLQTANGPLSDSGNNMMGPSM
ncbi:MAG TPA: hypothetical protein VGH38_23960 [Bryobacteraceae bacterium]|jgi:hypothetical protein